MSLHRNKALLVALPTLLGGSAHAATYEVGPDKPYAAITDVPLPELKPGDTVLIHPGTQPYRETFGIEVSGTPDKPIVFRGVLDSTGKRPVLDGADSRKGPGSHPRGIIHIVGDAGHVTVENLELRNAHADHGFPKNAAGIFAAGGHHLTFRNLDLHHNGNGFFSWVDAADILVEGCLIHDNGNRGSIFEHNVYTESNGITFQYNVIRPLAAGASGNNLKDRSARTVIRYNLIEGGNRTLDLVEADDGAWNHENDPIFVYGNVLIKHQDTPQAQVVHFGQDLGAGKARRLLHFFHNTVYSDRKDLTTLFFINARATAELRNNIFFTTATTAELLDPDDSSEATLVLGPNWISRNWKAGSDDAKIEGTNALIAGDDPGLRGAPSDMGLAAGSPAIDAGAALGSALSAHPVDRELAGRGEGRPRTDRGAPDLGAYAAGATPGVGTGGAPTNTGGTTALGPGGGEGHGEAPGGDDAKPRSKGCHYADRPGSSVGFLTLVGLWLVWWRPRRRSR